MKRSVFLKGLLTLTILVMLFSPQTAVQAAPPARPLRVSTADLISAMNSLRASYGHSTLIEDAIIDSVAQSTAETMAAQQLSWHIGNASGRIAAAGYGGGSKVQATENFAAGKEFTIEKIMTVWSDSAHMLPATNAAYCNIGAGIAVSPNGLTYYVLQAAYTSGKTCGDYTSSGTSGSVASSVSQVIMPVKTVMPDAGGKIYHEVLAGQTFWSIAIAYGTTRVEILKWNNLSESAVLKPGMKLLIPNSAITLTPTLNALQKLTPSADGRYYHTIQSGDTLTGIASEYLIAANNLMVWNGLNESSILQLGQKLFLQVTPPATYTPTTVPTATATATATATLTPGATASLTPAAALNTPTPPEEAPGSPPSSGPSPLLWLGVIFLIAGGIGMWIFSSYRKKPEKDD
jgi:LysM repeat protein